MAYIIHVPTINASDVNCCSGTVVILVCAHFTCELDWSIILGIEVADEEVHCSTEECISNPISFERFTVLISGAVIFCYFKESF